MGLLSVGEPLTWPETEKVAEYIKEHGIIQFLNLFNKLKNRKSDCLKWGDEIEYMLVKFDDENKTARLKLGCEQIVWDISEKERNGEDVECLWRPEFAGYMIEGTPGRPYGGLLAHFNLVEANMKFRREQMTKFIGDPTSTLMSLTVFPRLGCAPCFTYPEIKIDADLHKKNLKTKSLFFPDEVVNNHPRFLTLANNVRSRRGKKVDIQVPIFKDENTPNPFIDEFVKNSGNEDSMSAVKEGMIYMDAMGFGMGNSCLQMTFQGQNINEARYLYDQLTPLTPVMLALSAAAPIYRGYLSDIDCRWQVISASVDDRKPGEKHNNLPIRKSRYDSIDLYLHESSQKHNDINIAFNQEVHETLIKSGIDEILAKHISHLWIRDPISQFKDRVVFDDSETSEHFENLQSTNWQTMRFKPPPPDSNIGWRVEFRPTEIQISDFENAAIVCFLVLTTRAILAYNLKTTIPISLVDENMQTAQKKDAVLNEKFHFRTNWYNQDISQAKIEKLTVNQIVNGVKIMNKTDPSKNVVFKGLIPIIESYLADLDVDLATICTIDPYLKFVSKRASGEFKTNAKWIRDYVTGHKNYKKDSVVSEEINYDLLKKLEAIGSETCFDHDMFNRRECSLGLGTTLELTPGTRRVYGPSFSESFSKD